MYKQRLQEINIYIQLCTFTTKKNVSHSNMTSFFRFVDK